MWCGGPLDVATTHLTSGRPNVYYTSMIIRRNPAPSETPQIAGTRDSGAGWRDCRGWLLGTIDPAAVCSLFFRALPPGSGRPESLRN